MTTLREIHERCKARHHFDEWTLNPKGYHCACCSQPWPCPDYRDAGDALAILDNSDEQVYEVPTELGGKVHGFRLVHEWTKASA